MISKSKTISVIGMGHVGLPLLVYYYKKGYKVKGVDINKKLVNDLKKGITFQSEKGIDSNILRKLDFQTVYPDTNLYMICI